MTQRSCIYAGTVVHKRLSPRTHAFRYRVFALCLDVDEIDALDQRLSLFARGRIGLTGFVDRDYGAADDRRVGDKARDLLARAGLARWAERIDLLCYPRLLGYVFNPLSVYFCRDGQGTIGAVIYEVTNTFGERKSYIVATEGARGPMLAHAGRKELYVSPFTAADGTYGFHIRPPADEVVIGVVLREAGRPVLKTHFRGTRHDLTDAALAGAVLRHPLMTLKVTAAIHFEAARLWAKGVAIVPRHSSPAYSATLIASDGRADLNG